MPSEPYRVTDAAWPATGSLMVVTGRTVDADGAPGTLVMLLQRRSGGWCLDKDRDLPGVGTRYPQGSASVEVVGVAVNLTSPPSVEAPGCEPWWGQVRRNLRSLGAGLHCPIPEGPTA